MPGDHLLRRAAATLGLLALALVAPDLHGGGAQAAAPEDATTAPAAPGPAPEDPTTAPAAPGPAPITAETWTRAVGFAPDLADAPPAGTVVDAQSLAAWRRSVPQGVDLLVEKYALTLPVRAYEPVHPSRGYIAATNRYRGEPRLIPDAGPREQGLEGYTAGLPFPQPQSGRELAYDYALAYRGDDGTYHYGVFWISAKKGVERWEEWRWEFIRRVQFRTDLEPIPKYEELAAQGVAGVALTYALSPQDKRGYASLYRGKTDPEDIAAFIYLPPTRRVLKVAIGTRGDAWNSTDLLYEDVGGYTGHPEWMAWKLLEKTTVLAPVHAELPHGKQALEQVFDFKTWPHWNLRAKWEPRPVYVVEATPRFDDYPYSRMLLYFDAETFFIPVKLAWDKQGRLWKVIINASNASPDMDTQPLQIGTALVVDLLSEHATAFPAYGYEANVGHDPRDFTEARLRKMGR